jgi:probable HAF family extracellular repeat protein
MCHNLKTVMCAVGTVALLLLVGINPAFAQKGGGKPQLTYPYAFTDLGQPGFRNDGGWQKAYGINNPNDDGVLLAVGGSDHALAAAGAVWEVAENGTVIGREDLPPQSGTVAVNDSGMIAFTTYREDRVVMLFDIPGIGIIEPPGASSFRPAAVNNLGQVVGYGANSRRGGLWTPQPDGSFRFRSLEWFTPHAINDWGLMAGELDDAAAIAWFEDGELRVEKLPGLPSGGESRALGINNFGEVVGFSNWGLIRPFLWTPTDGLIALADRGIAYDVNDVGQIVGWTEDKVGVYACLWDDGQMLDLNALSGVGTKSFRLTAAEAINNAGHIVGRSTRYKGQWIDGYGTFVLMPNP